MFCNECKAQRNIFQLGAPEIGTVYNDGVQRLWYPVLSCGHTEYIQTSPIGNIPPTAKRILTRYYDSQFK